MVTGVSLRGGPTALWCPLGTAPENPVNRKEQEPENAKAEPHRARRPRPTCREVWGWPSLGSSLPARLPQPEPAGEPLQTPSLPDQPCSGPGAGC